MEKDGALYRSWTLWYLIPDRFTEKNGDWTQFLHKVCVFSTIEQMWAALNSVEKASYLPKGCRYYIFKGDVMPLWEDSRNRNGKEVIIEHQIAKANKDKINEKWENALCYLLGETLKNSELVNGIEFTVRTETFKISFWVSESNEDVYKSIGDELKRITDWKAQIRFADLKAAPKK